MARTKEFDTAVILDKAIDLFWFKGYNGASMQDVVDALGLSRSSLYDTFGDKRQLYLAALERYRNQAAAGLIEMVNTPRHTIKSLEKIFDMLVNNSFSDRFPRGCFMVNSAVELAPHDKAIDQLVRDNMQDIEDALCELIKRGQASGEIAAGTDARAMARFLFNTISGLRVAAKSGVEKKVYKDIVQVALTAVK